ncbi:hypothetical protein ACFQRB_06695 [Halobaculum litoreum]|uniref:Uncharacterized protein n=1 Tax=Halobaculum litoreum TaxID=3031998 RepID=A0ABD5XS13_9EURY
MRVRLAEFPPHVVDEVGHLDDRQVEVAPWIRPNRFAFRAVASSRSLDATIAPACVRTAGSPALARIAWAFPGRR